LLIDEKLGMAVVRTVHERGSVAPLTRLSRLGEDSHMPRLEPVSFQPKTHRGVADAQPLRNRVHRGTGIDQLL
jgi:hypothetical protein